MSPLPQRRSRMRVDLDVAQARIEYTPTDEPVGDYDGYAVYENLTEAKTASELQAREHRKKWGAAVRWARAVKHGDLRVGATR